MKFPSTKNQIPICNLVLEILFLIVLQSLPMSWFGICFDTALTSISTLDNIAALANIDLNIPFFRAG